MAAPARNNISVCGSRIGEKKVHLIIGKTSHSSEELYSYRTFDCGIMFGMTTEDIRKFFQMMIEKKGRFAADNITDPLRIMKDSSENNSGFHVHFPVSIR